MGFEMQREGEEQSAFFEHEKGKDSDDEKDNDTADEDHGGFISSLQALG